MPCAVAFCCKVLVEFSREFLLLNFPQLMEETSEELPFFFLDKPDEALSFKRDHCGHCVAAKSPPKVSSSRENRRVND